jgi:serine/threonine protein phosphatase PrpC
MFVSTQGFHTPKRGNVESEYEDAYYPARACREDMSEFRCAVADGASESAFSREWARLLVRGYHRRSLSIARLQGCWRQIVTRRPVPWYLEEKIRRGAHATFVGLSIRETDAKRPQGGSWRVLAIGDSCLFHVRDGALLTVAPMSTSDEFNNHPHLISTDPATGFGMNASRPTVISGEWQPNDEFYLVTDALAEWALGKHEAGRPPWTLFRRLGENGGSNGVGQGRFEDLVSKLREKDGLHNDDTTLLRVELS